MRFCLGLICVVNWVMSLFMGLGLYLISFSHLICIVWFRGTLKKEKKKTFLCDPELGMSLNRL